MVLGNPDVRYSVRTANQWDEYHGAMTPFALIETSHDHLRRARSVATDAGRAEPARSEDPGSSFCAAAELEGLAVLHDGRDFDLIATMTDQPCEWVVPPGTID